MIISLCRNASAMLCMRIFILLSVFGICGFSCDFIFSLSAMECPRFTNDVLFKFSLLGMFVLDIEQESNHCENAINTVACKS